MLWWLAAEIVLGLIGIGLVFNCAVGLFSKEGRWDGESSAIMFWSQLLGILIGIFFVLNMLSALGLRIFPLVSGE